MNVGLTTIYLIRHGDEKTLAEKFENEKLAAIFSSTAKDAKIAAQKLADKHKLSIVEEKNLKKPTSKKKQLDFEAFIEFLRKVARENENKTIVIVTHGQFLRKFLVEYKYGTDEEFAPGSVDRGGYIKLESNGHDFFATETYKINLKSKNLSSW